MAPSTWCSMSKFKILVDTFVTNLQSYDIIVLKLYVEITLTRSSTRQYIHIVTEKLIDSLSVL